MARRTAGAALAAKGPVEGHKLQAAERFVGKLLAAPARASIAKILLFGSVARGEAVADSDVDVAVVAAGSLPSIREACQEAALETMLEMGEDVEPLVRTLNDWREPSSWLVHRVRSEGKEVYSMDAKTIKRKEMEALYELASIYLQATSRLLASGAEDEGSLRLAIDGGHNVIELCAKAFLLSQIDTLPKSHGGVKTLFSDHFIKTGILPRVYGRKFSHCLQHRNEARYDPAAEVTKEKARTVAEFAGMMTAALEKYLVGQAP